MKYSLTKADLLVPTADSANNSYAMEVLGNKTDAAATGAVSATESLMAYSKQNVTNTETLVTRSVPDITSGTTSYLDAGGLQEIKALTITKATEVFFMVDLSNMTQNGTVMIQSKVDGTNYRSIGAVQFMAGQGDGAGIGPLYVNTDTRVVYVEGADEGAARDIPYRTIQITREV